MSTNNNNYVIDTRPEVTFPNPTVPLQTVQTVQTVPLQPVPLQSTYIPTQVTSKTDKGCYVVNTPKAKTPWGLIIFWNVVIIIAVIIILFLIGLLVYNAFVNAFFKFELSFNNNLQGYCESLVGKTATVPAMFLDPSKFVTTSYHYSLSTDLIFLCNFTSNLNCQSVLNTPFTNAQIIAALGPRFTTAEQLIIISNSNGNQVVYGVIYRSTNLVAIVWAGSLIGAQWVTDLEFSQVPATGINNASGNAHKGFYDAYITLQSTVRSAVTSLTPQQTLIITGHSLGGAMSTLCYLDTVNLSTQPIIHYSYASPRVGNVSFAGSFNTAALVSFRVFNTEDVIPQLPPPEIGQWIYEHVTGSGIVPFTVNLGTVKANHMDAYVQDMPDCPLIVAPCSS